MMLPGWYGLQRNVEVVVLEKVLRDTVAKNFCGKRFVFEFHEKLTSRLRCILLHAYGEQEEPNI
jgi:phosphoenolpyruvate carboxylase